MQDRAAEFLIKEIRQGDDVPVSEFTQEWLYNLPVTDGKEPLLGLIEQGNPARASRTVTADIWDSAVLGIE